MSAEARARLERPAASPLRPPPPEDVAAIAQWRAIVHEAWLAGDPSAEACGHRELTLGGVRCLVTGTVGGGESTASDDRPIVIYHHGGGFALGSPEVALPITERLARYGSVVSLDYRLAPEHPYPDAFDDARRVLEAVSAAAPGVPVVLAGDSAGANLAVSVALECPETATVAALVLFSPHLEQRPQRGGSDRSSDPRSDVDDATARWLRDAYCGGLDPDDPRLSPLRAELAGLPPTLIQVGTVDSTLGSAVRFARSARVSGVDVTLDVWDGLWHAWHYHRNLPEADRALAEAGRFLGAMTP